MRRVMLGRMHSERGHVEEAMFWVLLPEHTWSRPVRTALV